MAFVDFNLLYRQISPDVYVFLSLCVDYSYMTAYNFRGRQKNHWWYSKRNVDNKQQHMKMSLNGFSNNKICLPLKWKFDWSNWFKQTKTATATTTTRGKQLLWCVREDSKCFTLKIAEKLAFFCSKKKPAWVHHKKIHILANKYISYLNWYNKNIRFHHVPKCVTNTNWGWWKAQSFMLLYYSG